MNDSVPRDELDRRDRFEVALYVLAGRGDDGDATRMCAGDSSIDRMKRDAFINAAINDVPAILKKMRPSYTAIVDLPALAARVRLEVIMRRLE